MRFLTDDLRLYLLKSLKELFKGWNSLTFKFLVILKTVHAFESHVSHTWDKSNKALSQQERFFYPYFSLFLKSISYILGKPMKPYSLSAFA